jgi:hypothetical protein
LFRIKSSLTYYYRRFGHVVNRTFIILFVDKHSFPVAPVIEQFHFPRHLQLGMRARLVCTVISGDPPFNIRWLHNGTQIWTGSATGSRLPARSSSFGTATSSYSSIADHVQLSGVTGKVDEFSADLSFQSVSVEHDGNYTCEVHNDLASARHTAQLVVEGNTNRN